MGKDYTGKTYKATNSYVDTALERILEEKIVNYRQGYSGRGGHEYSLIREPGAYITEKANIEYAIVITKLKNRINHLEGRIAIDTKNLVQAKSQLVQLQKKDKIV
jgi:hypothetical protein